MYNIGMNRLSTRQRTKVITALVEGNSIRATCRMTGAAKGTVTRLFIEVGKSCYLYQYRHLKNLQSRRIQCDEIWSFCYAKQDNLPEKKRGKLGYGDVWTYVAIDADTKLVPCWLVGLRTANYAYQFMNDLAKRLTNRVQLTTDGHRKYLDAVDDVFGNNIDYAMLVKLYGSEAEGEKRYSPAKCNGTETHVIKGNPDPAQISTSFVERQNLTMRMNMRRFTRLTNGFSKKVDNLKHAVALHFMYYNFVRVHKTLAMTPAMAAGITDHVWTLEEIVTLEKFQKPSILN
ncbi:MAG: DDE-type integrase/transposase/recombinase [Chloroflexi bacterium]|nr:DDE-type integrase/transposase/recombinase [Chloroflexota bacterium]